MSARGLIQDWCLGSEEGEIFREIRSQLDFLTRMLFDSFEPCPYGGYEERLMKWIDNVDSEQDKKTLYKLASRVSFIGLREFQSLYRHAFRTTFMNWVISGSLNSLVQPDSERILAKEIAATWFCPVTDSMRINAFYKANDITGRDLKPDWRSLAELGDVKRVEKFIQDEGITRLVLLEDFVGSGTQMKKAARFAASIPNLKTLLLPLLCCPDGVEVGKHLSVSLPELTFEAAAVLPASAFIRIIPNEGEIDIAESVRKMAHQTCNRTQPHEPRECVAFGFKGVGALVVLYSNCPNNSLPLIHSESDDWHPLFPRITRV